MDSTKSGKPGFSRFRFGGQPWITLYFGQQISWRWLFNREHAPRNLRQVQIWADRHNHPHLGQGTLDRAQRLGNLNRDMQSLVSVVRARASAPRS